MKPKEIKDRDGIIVELISAITALRTVPERDEFICPELTLEESFSMVEHSIEHIKNVVHYLTKCDSLYCFKSDKD